jgi:hypothetical protein
MVQEVIDEATARVVLARARDQLETARENASAALADLRNRIVRLRPTGLVTVNEMAEVIGRDRNYVDSVWSTYGETTEGRQTRVAAVPEDDTDAQGAKVGALADLRYLVDVSRNADKRESTVRSERDRLIAMVYAAKMLGPTAIAALVKVDRNHVLRIARRQGVAPVHRQGARNQYTAR